MCRPGQRSTRCRGLVPLFSTDDIVTGGNIMAIMTAPIRLYVTMTNLARGLGVFCAGLSA